MWEQASIKFCQNWIQLHGAKKNHDDENSGEKKPYWGAIEELISWCERRSSNSVGEKEGMQAAGWFMHCMKRSSRIVENPLWSVSRCCSHPWWQCRHRKIYDLKKRGVLLSERADCFKQGHCSIARISACSPLGRCSVVLLSHDTEHWKWRFTESLDFMSPF